MDYKKITEANRIAWNEVTPRHQAGRKIDLKEKFAESGYSTLDEIDTAKLKQIGLKDKVVAQLCCNNGRELLSLINLGASSGVGFDISDAAIDEAKELAQISKLKAEFVRTDVYEIAGSYNGKFDLVYLSIGAMTWLPDLERFFEVISRILKPGGDLLIYEMHPFLYMFALEDDPEYDREHLKEVMFSYFKTEPWKDESGLDYIGNTKYESSTKFSYTQKLSDIFNPIISNGMEIKEFIEYDHDISEIWKGLEPFDMLPMCYHLHAKKN